MSAATAIKNPGMGAPPVCFWAFIHCTTDFGTTAFTTIGSSRINPQAERATRFAVFSYDKNFENYIINRLDLPLSSEKTVTSVCLRSLDRGYDLLVYGLCL